ncbi:GGDEF domain-containing protein [Halomonas caseinilytica]|uniref:Diguanylate cyclase n=1 Tax=Halomonas caseinilytica TaxID=438744 RepID=A0A1M6UBV2_9GAMM|nr:diguanylate cyclase [Halomonas caseinilytica]SEM95992.1 Diguanylate cyclase, GGDEF domain [Halomonas caseinilytica]SHK66725.1 diguanylate cyclase [Halomonas caseinilytica]
MPDIEPRQTRHRPLTLVLAIGTLLLLGQSLWFYLAGEYQRMPLPALLAPIMLMATLLASLGGGHARTAAYMVLICGFLLIAAELPRPAGLPALWIGLPPVLALLLLPLVPAILLNLGLAPVWMALLDNPRPDADVLLAYLSLVAMATLASWGRLRQQALLRATDPWDPECRAVSRSHLHERLAGELDRTELLGQSLSVLLIHLPQLEIADEQFGPKARQALLDALCETAAGRCRAHDILGRAGDSVFWLVMPNTTESGALLVQQRLSRAFEPIILVETGPLETRTRLVMRHAGEDQSSFEHRLHTATRRLTTTRDS